MASTKKSYTQLRSELEQVMAELQAETVDIDEAIVLHKKATALIDTLEKHLQTAKLTITKLTSGQIK